jgi:hypothetical protein
MHAMHKVSVAILVAAMSVLPVTGAFAATPAAVVTFGQKADVMPASSLKPMIGKWTQADITALDAAKTVKVYDTRTLYTPVDQQVVAGAQTASTADLTKFHGAINADANLKAWFAKNKIDVSRVVGLSDSNGAVAIFLY